MNARRILFAISSISIGIVFSVVFLEIVFRFLPVSDALITLPVNSENPYFRFKENREITWSYDYNFSIVTKKSTNNYGFFNDHNYTSEDTTPLLGVIGDSYVEALQVSNSAAMHGVLSERVGANRRVYSFGSSGSPLSNYLAYANLATNEFNADALVFIIVANDFDESLRKYRNAPGMHYFSAEGGSLELVRRDYRPSSVKGLIRHSALARYLVINLQIMSHIARFRSSREGAEPEYVGNTSANSSKERIKDSTDVIDGFFEELPTQTGLPSDRILFVVDGMRPHLYDSSDLKAASGSYFDRMRRYFSAAASRSGYEVVDMQPVFIRQHQSTGARFEFPTNGHWNEHGHALVAERIGESVVFKSVFE